MSRKDEKQDKYKGAQDQFPKEFDEVEPVENDSPSYVIGVDFGVAPDYTALSPVAVETKAAPQKNFGVEFKVKAINLNIVDGKMLVYDTSDPSNVWWIPANQIKQTLREQVVSSNDSDKWEKPYNWDSEINELVITPDQVRLGLYYLGYHKQTELNFRQVLLDLVTRGFLPVMKENK